MNLQGFVRDLLRHVELDDWVELDVKHVAGLLERYGFVEMRPLTKADIDNGVTIGYGCVEGNGWYFYTDAALELLKGDKP